MKVLSDISLVARVVAFNDKRAFDSLVRKYQSPVRRFFLNQTLGNQALSDDLEQETFIKAYTNISKYHNLAGFSTWLYRIAYHVLLDEARARKHTEDIDTCRAADTGKTADEELRMDIYLCLKILRPAERICVTLQLVEGQSLKRISEITGMATGTVKSNIFRGKSKLATYLKGNGYDGK